MLSSLNSPNISTHGLFYSQLLKSLTHDSHPLAEISEHRAYAIGYILQSLSVISLLSCILLSLSYPEVDKRGWYG